MKLAPIVELTDLPASATAPKLTVHLGITDGGGGIGLVRLFVNGTAVVQDDDPSLSSQPGVTATRSYMVQLASGSNQLRAVALNGDDSMQSNPAVASINLGFVTTLGLAHYVDAQVPNLAEKQFKRAQYPTVDINGQEFPLTKVK